MDRKQELMLSKGGGDSELAVLNAFCGRSGTMMRLQLVTASDDEKEKSMEEESELLSGAVVMECLAPSPEG